MKKSFLFLGAALCTLGFSACSDDEEGGQVGVGITEATVTPQGGMIYKVVAAGTLLENTNDSVDWDVTDAQLAQAMVTVKPTIGATAYYNGQAIAPEGMVMDVTSPVTLQVRDGAGNEAVYTLNVVRATTAKEGALLRKATSYNGFPAKDQLVDWDMAYFKDRFYAIVTSYDGTTENYQLFSSTDGLNWSEVAYQTSTTGVVLPEGQTGYVIGGEGARLVTFKDKMYVIGGARTKGPDKYGNEAEMSWGVMPNFRTWRSYSTSDGVTFECDSVDMVCLNNGEAVNCNDALTHTAVNLAELNGKLYMTGGYMGTMQFQSGNLFACTENGKDWEVLSPTADDNQNISGITNSAFFAFKGKLWSVGGFRNYLSPSSYTTNCINAIYSSADGGLTWTKEADLPEAMAYMYGMKAVANDNVVYMFGGERYTAEGPIFVSPQIFRSVDGVNWEAVETDPSFTPRRNAHALLQGNVAWIFGGNITNGSGSYAYPADGDEYSYDTWMNLMQ